MTASGRPRPLAYRALSLALAGLSVSCAPAASAPAAASPPEAPLAPKPRAEIHSDVVAPAPGDALQARVAEALTHVAKLRGLPPLTPVKGRLISREEITRYLEGELDSEVPASVMKANEAMLYGFGTVDAGFDYRATTIELMTSELLGFYDPKQKTFFVGGDLEGDEANVTLWHELVHALQDQHYDLSHLTDWQPDQGDSQAAVHALAEGDATSVMLDALLEPRGTTALDVPDGLMRAQNAFGTAASSAPPILVRSLLAPYVDGLAFTNALRRRGGFAAVDEAWHTLPASTEQLLHVDKFLVHEAPLSIKEPTAPPTQPPLRSVFHDVMGEESLRILLEEWLPSHTAATAAGDWGGDRLSVFANQEGSRWAVGWHLRFDDAGAARRAFVAFARSLEMTDRGYAPRLPKSEAWASSIGDKVCHARHSQGPIALVRRGADLGVAVGPFSRTEPSVVTDPDCKSAESWAASIVSN